MLDKKRGVTSCVLYLAGAALFSVLSGCATPHVVDEMKISDQDLDCNALLREIISARKYENLADIAKKEANDDSFTSGVVIPGLFFPPLWALLPVSIALDGAQTSNIDEAQTAALDRQRHLQKLYNEKTCPPK